MSLDGLQTARDMMEMEYKVGDAVKQAGLLPDNNPKSKFGVQKTQYHYVPSTAIRALADVMKLGASKYGAYNWRDASVSATVYYDAIRRHLDAWFDGEDIDPESGRSHLAHAMACAAICIDAMSVGKFNDDRYKLNK